MNRKKVLQPAIRWTGSKRRIASQLAEYFPKDTTCFYDPFVGGGSILPLRNSKAGVAGDIIDELISLWRLIKTRPLEVADQYEYYWSRMQAEGHDVYYEVRSYFNKSREPMAFLFLTRTCVNGMIRFNRDGNFNSSLHLTRPGIAPDRLRKILIQWSEQIQDVEFEHGDYRQTLASVKAGDFVFLDPPYAGSGGLYKPGSFCVNDFYDELERLNRVGVKWMLTFDGHSGDRKYNGFVPHELYKTKISLVTGISPFAQVLRKSLEAVHESVYMNY